MAINTMMDKTIVMMAMATEEAEVEVMLDTIDRANATYCDESPTKCGSNLSFCYIKKLSQIELFVNKIDNVQEILFL